MPLNWPTIAQGSGTGTTYLGPSGNTWTWNGNSWDTASSQIKGGFGGPWVIFDRYGKAYPFQNLQSAIDWTDSSNSTINLFQDVKEIVTSAYHVRIYKDISINLNGFTYTLDASTMTSEGIVISNVTNTTYPPLTYYQGTVKIFNGKIELINTNNHPTSELALIGEPDYELFELTSTLTTGMKWIFNNVVFESEINDWYVGTFRSRVIGGKFYAKPKDIMKGMATAVKLQSVTKTSANKNCIFTNIDALSTNGTGIEFRGGLAGSTGTTSPTSISMLINSKGTSQSNLYTWDVWGINVLPPPSLTSINIPKGNRYATANRIINCKAHIDSIDTSNNDSNSYAMELGPYSQAFSCDISAPRKIGLKMSAAMAVLCRIFGYSAGGFTEPAVNSTGGSILKLVTIDIPYMSDKIAFRTEGNFVHGSTGDRIHNCYISGGIGVYAPNLQNRNLLEVNNSEISYRSYGIYSPNGATSVIRVLNNTIQPREINLYPGANNPIIIAGSTSIIVGNYLSGYGGKPAIGAGQEGLSIPIYVANNTAENLTDVFKTSDFQQRITWNANTQGQISTPSSTDIFPPSPYFLL